MPKLIFIAHDGTEYQADAEIGDSVMKAAANASVPGILADCGGEGSCGTCHCYIDAAWIGRIPAPASNESEMLECVLDPQENSRLSCQVKVTQELDRMVIRLPESQV